MTISNPEYEQEYKNPYGDQYEIAELQGKIALLEKALSESEELRVLHEKNLQAVLLVAAAIGLNLKPVIDKVPDGCDEVAAAADMIAIAIKKQIAEAVLPDAEAAGYLADGYKHYMKSRELAGLMLFRVENKYSAAAKLDGGIPSFVIRKIYEGK